MICTYIGSCMNDEIKEDTHVYTYIIIDITFAETHGIPIHARRPSERARRQTAKDAPYVCVSIIYIYIYTLYIEIIYVYIYIHIQTICVYIHIYT